jgi:hypothetical protein
LEFDALDDLGQLIFALQSPPGLCCCETSLKTMSLPVVGDSDPFVRTVR